MIDFEREGQKDGVRQNERIGDIRLIEVKRTRERARGDREKESKRDREGKKKRERKRQRKRQRICFRLEYEKTIRCD